MIEIEVHVEKVEVPVVEVEVHVAEVMKKNALKSIKSGFEFLFCRKYSKYL